MKTLLTILFLAFATVAQANTVTWQDNSGNESGFAIEMLTGGAWVEVARIAANVTTYTDAFTEGVYRLRAFIDIGGGSFVYSAYSNTAAKLNAPVNTTVK